MTYFEFRVDIFAKDVECFPEPRMSSENGIHMGTGRFRILLNFMKNAKIGSPRAIFFSEISPHLRPDTIRKARTPAVEFSVNCDSHGSGFKASMLINVHADVFRSVPFCTMATLSKLEKRSLVFE